MVDHDRLSTIDDPGRGGADRPDGSGGNGAERHLDVAVRQPALESTADLVELDAETLGDELDR